MKRKPTLRDQIINLGYSISGDIDHGECFYVEEMLNEFINDLDKLKTLATQYFKENQEDDE